MLFIGNLGSSRKSTIIIKANVRLDSAGDQTPKCIFPLPLSLKTGSKKMVSKETGGIFLHCTAVSLGTADATTQLGNQIKKNHCI